jgi:hypothetical protein
MVKKDNALTNENIKKKYKNNFELANHAIKMAQDIMVDGKSVTLMEIMDMLNVESLLPVPSGN